MNIIYCEVHSHAGGPWPAAGGCGDDDDVQAHGEGGRIQAHGGVCVFHSGEDADVQNSGHHRRRGCGHEDKGAGDREVHAGHERKASASGDGMDHDWRWATLVQDGLGRVSQDSLVPGLLVHRLGLEAWQDGEAPLSHHHNTAVCSVCGAKDLATP